MRLFQPPPDEVLHVDTTTTPPEENARTIFEVLRRRQNRSSDQTTDHSSAECGGAASADLLGRACWAWPPIRLCPHSQVASILVMSIDVRQVELDDVPSLQRNCFTLNTIEQTRANVESALRKSESGEGTSLVGVRGGEVLGNVSVTRNAHRLQRHRAHLGGFVIHPSAQGQGLARALTAAAAQWAAERGCKTLELDCRGGTHAEEAYRGLGFREWGRLPMGFIEEAGTFDQVCFYLVISEWLVSGQSVITALGERS
jgi:GNAT superfamily N-acetyltransferase